MSSSGDDNNNIVDRNDSNSNNNIITIKRSTFTKILAVGVVRRIRWLPHSLVDIHGVITFYPNTISPVWNKLEVLVSRRSSIRSLH